MREAGPLPEEVGGLAYRIKNLPLTIHGLASIKRAISTAGGVQLSELTCDFMLKSRPGVFVAGEMLDWDAPTGGYLLQAAFATASAAAGGALAWLKNGSGQKGNTITS